MRNLASPLLAMLAIAATGAAEQAWAHPAAIGETLAQTMSHQVFALHHLPAVLIVACVLYFLARTRRTRRPEQRRDR